MQIALQIVLKNSSNNASRLSAVQDFHKHSYNLWMNKRNATKKMRFAQSVKMMINISKLQLT